LLLVPKLGLVRSAILFGMLNVAVALWTTWLFAAHIARPWSLRATSALVLIALGAGMAGAEKITSFAESNLYADEVILARSTRYQRIVVTRWKDDLRLFLNSHLQFSSRDEYRYHESLVHPGLASRDTAHRVLVLGGGDGLAVREILRYPNVERVTLVDLDPEMTRLFTEHSLLSRLNDRSLKSPRVAVVNADAFVWLDGTSEIFDFVVVDFPDPTNYSLGKLYTTAFYRRLSQNLSPHALIAVQSTSPLFARQSYWCIVETMRAAGLKVWPYHVYVPSFGEWGFVLAGAAGTTWEPPARLPSKLRFLTAANLPSLFHFPLDMEPVAAEVNRLNDQVLVRYYDREWSAVTH
jgi:spermidine synthase